MDGPRGEQRSPIRVLQSLEQPIVFIGTCVSGDDGPQCLVALGQRGKLLLVRSKETSSESKEPDYSKNQTIHIFNEINVYLKDSLNTLSVLLGEACR